MGDRTVLTIEDQPPRTPTRRGPLIGQFRIWHMALLVLFVAIAIVNIQDQRLSDPPLIALASVGFGAYGALGWAAWRVGRRFEARLGPTRLLILYLVAMSVAFLAATVVFLAIQHLYLVGHF